MSIPVNIALKIWPAVLGMLIVLGIKQLEYFFMPVVTGFTITHMVHIEDRVHLYGLMRNERNCEYVGVLSRAKNSDGDTITIPLFFGDNPMYSTKVNPTGEQEWGPWFLEIPVAPGIREVTLESVHNCHVFWHTQTHLITFPIIKEINP